MRLSRGNRTDGFSATFRFRICVEGVGGRWDCRGGGGYIIQTNVKWQDSNMLFRSYRKG